MTWPLRIDGQWLAALHELDEPLMGSVAGGVDDAREGDVVADGEAVDGSVGEWSAEGFGGHRVPPRAGSAATRSGLLIRTKWTGWLMRWSWSRGQGAVPDSA